MYTEGLSYEPFYCFNITRRNHYRTYKEVGCILFSWKFSIFGLSSWEYKH